MKRAAERLAPAVWVVATVKLFVHLTAQLFTARFGYEYFVDELYFDACGRHLAWGYIDMPPFHPALTAAVRAMLGDSLFAIRLLPALAGAALVLLAGVLARDLGGGFGQCGVIHDVINTAVGARGSIRIQAGFCDRDGVEGGGEREGSRRGGSPG